jgi:hypothetical protein
LININPVSAFPFQAKTLFLIMVPNIILNLTVGTADDFSTHKNTTSITI